MEGALLDVARVSVDGLTIDTGLGSGSALDVDNCLTSKIPPPEVTSGFSAVCFRPQNDHRLCPASACDCASTTAGASGSPRLDLLSQGESVDKFSVRLVRLARDS